MALSPKDVVTAAREILNGPYLAERERLERIARAVNPHQYRTVDGITPLTVEMPIQAPVVMSNLAQKSRTNYLPLVLDVLTDTLIIDGYRAPKATDEAPAWDGWQRNGWDARQGGVNRDALQYGIGYAYVMPGIPVPKMRPISPRSVTVLYQDPVEDEWPISALHRVDKTHLRYIDEECVYRLAWNNGGALEYIDKSPHGFPVPPIVRFRDQMLTDSCDQLGVIEPLISIQKRIDETVFGQLVAQYFTAFVQRYIIGWVPKDDQEKMEAKASEFWTFKDPDVKVGTFQAGSPEPYLRSKDSAVADMGSLAHIPAQELTVGGVSNLSAEALAALEAGRYRHTRSIETSLGESYEQMLRLYSYAAKATDDIDNDAAAVRWRDETARSLAQTVDALGKMVTMMGVPAEAAWEDLPGMTDEKLKRWKAVAADTNTLGKFAALLDQQGNPQPPTPAVSPNAA